MSTMRAYTREFRESAVGLVLSEGLSIRKAADDLGMPYHTLHGWVRAARRSRRKPVPRCSTMTSTLPAGTSSRTSETCHGEVIPRIWA